MDELQLAYSEYCAAKLDIDEEPFDFKTWVGIEMDNSSPIGELAKALNTD